MKKGIVLLTGFYWHLVFSGWVQWRSKKNRKRRKKQNDKFYQTGMNYENKLKNTYTILWDGSIDKIPNIDTFSNDNRQEVLDNLSNLEKKN